MSNHTYKRSSKVIASLILIIVLAILAVGCSDTPDDQNDNTLDGSVTYETPAPISPTPTDEAGATADVTEEPVETGDPTATPSASSGGSTNMPTPSATTAPGTNTPDAGTPKPTVTPAPSETSAPHTHVYSTTRVIKNATCTEAGTKRHTCYCGSYYTETIPAAGHSYKKTDEKTSTSTSNGETIKTTTITYTCSNCKDTYKDTRTETVIEGHTHAYSTSRITKQATCTDTGIKTFTCYCGSSYTETIPATGHDFHTKTIHHDAVYGTRDKVETWIHTANYYMFHIPKAGADANTGRYTYLEYTAPGSYLYNAIQKEKIGNYDEMIASDPLLAKYYERIEKQIGRNPKTWHPVSMGNVCEDHLLIQTEEKIYNPANPDESLEHLYLYSPLVPFYDAISDVSGFKFESLPERDIVMAEKARRQALSIADYGNDHHWTDYPNYISSNWTIFNVSESFEKVVGTEKYVITPAYDETVTACATCGKKN